MSVQPVYVQSQQPMQMQQPMYQPPMQMQQPVVIHTAPGAMQMHTQDASLIKPTGVLRPGNHAIVYETEIKQNAKCMGCTVAQMVPQWAVCMVACPCCWLCTVPCCMAACVRGEPCANYCSWESKLQPRSYVRIYENRVESNYSKASYWGCCVFDDIYVRHFDMPVRKHARIATACTPYHCCCCIGCASPVVAVAPTAERNSCWWNCCREFYPAMPDPIAFIQAYTLAQSAWQLNQRFGPNAFLKAGGSMQMAPMQMAPMQVKMV